MRRSLSNPFLVALCTFALTSKLRAERFGDLYAEGVYLGRAKTTAGLLNARYGETLRPGLETYGVLRMGGDTRTYLEASDAVYNDNFMFLAAGLDYLNLLPGMRFSAQVGGSIDLNPKIHRQGFDFRTGMYTYHEAPSFTDSWNQEIYSEAVYVHRYRNFIADILWKLVFKAYEGNTWDINPLGAFVMSVDSKGYDYNRFVEFRTGVRVRAADWANLAFHPMYVFGTRWNVDHMADANYREFRFLVTAYTAF
jgi:hypothetical protein